MTGQELVFAKEAAVMFEGQEVSFEMIPFGNGHIHQTYLLKGAKQTRLLQKINTNVFPKPELLMHNILSFTEHAKKLTAQAGGDISREVLDVVLAKNGNSLVCKTDGYYRMYEYIENSISFEQPPSSDILKESGRLLGKFLSEAKDLPKPIYEIIPGFHNTPERLKQLAAAEAKDPFGRKKEVKDLLAFAWERKELAGYLFSQNAMGKLPIRVTHNDPKLNNFLFDKTTKHGLCLIDLDTIMPGLAAWDFGDALRTGASCAAEDETDLNQVSFSLDYYKAFLNGYLRETKEILTHEEQKVLPISPLIMTLECGIRFLTDYLLGDIYFRINAPEQNRNRCRAQFALVKDMEQKLEEMETIYRNMK